MNLQILPNKNIFFTFLALNLAGYKDNNDKPLFPLRKQILEEFSDCDDYESVKQLKRLLHYEYIHPSYLLDFAICSPDGFSEILYDKNRFDDDFVKDNKNFDKNREFVEHTRHLVKQLNLHSYYEQAIESYLTSLCQEHQSKVEGLEIEEEFEKFWGIKLRKDGIAYPNLLEAYSRAKGFEIGESLISVSGPGGYDKEKDEIYFDGEGIILHFIHEASHSYAERVIDSTEAFKSPEFKERSQKLFEKIRIELEKTGKAGILESYGRWDSYFEETLVRVAESSFLTPAIFAETWHVAEIKDYEKKLENVYDQGFLLVHILKKTIKEHRPSGWENVLVEAANESFATYFV